MNATAHDHDCHAEGCCYPDGTRVVDGDNLADNPQGATPPEEDPNAPVCSKCGRGSWDVEEEYDGHGIYMGRWCPKCRAKALAGFRSDIFDAYECDEPIEPED